MKKNVLVVEDNKFNQKLIETQLSQLNVNTMFAFEGEQALTMLSENTYNFIFTDCAMEGVDGYELTRKIRKSKLHYADIPIIAITGNENNKQACLDIGMNEVLIKPISIKEFQRCMDAYADK